MNGVWQAQSFGTCPMPSAGCPSSPAAEHSACDIDGGYARCTYDEGEVCLGSVCDPSSAACGPSPPA